MFVEVRGGVLLVTLLLLLLSACQLLPSPGREMGERTNAVPAHVSQALSVPLANQDLPRGLTPQSAKGLYIVSRMVYDIEGRPAYLANLLGREEVFDKALEKADRRERVYLTGLVKDVAFYGDVFPAGVLQQISAVCPECQLGYHGHLLYGIRPDGTWVDTWGKPLPAGFVEEARKFRKEMRAKHEETGFLRELSRRWDDLIQKSPFLRDCAPGGRGVPSGPGPGEGVFPRGAFPAVRGTRTVPLLVPVVVYSLPEQRLRFLHRQHGQAAGGFWQLAANCV
ncbi:hypothetical protein [Thermus tenuipuniceus]|uniref:hypothetical protein n=1 Tax=Thermus tenuipuniceus TaxID=2078690 RepID=UPI000FF87F44|nr:hypothetical protein [Thermus tenuipuniceus]